MRNVDIQVLLAAARYYAGALDGDLGSGSQTAIAKILKNNADDLPASASRWTLKRRAVAAAQIILNHAGYEAGGVDGLSGHNTQNAFAQWQYFKLHGKKQVKERRPPSAYKSPTGKFTIPRQRDCVNFYGAPGPAIERQLTSLPAPYAMRIDYNLAQKARTLRVHRLCAPRLEAALLEIRERYGDAELRRLGLDRYAGAYNHRKMRNGSSWSMHAYGCAIDFFARPNGLNMRCPQALFCKREYQAFHDIMERHGWISLGRAIGRDWMHYQAASVR